MRVSQHMRESSVPAWAWAKWVETVEEDLDQARRIAVALYAVYRAVLDIGNDPRMPAACDNKNCIVPLCRATNNARRVLAEEAKR